MITLPIWAVFTILTYVCLFTVVFLGGVICRACDQAWDPTDSTRWTSWRTIIGCSVLWFVFVPAAMFGHRGMFDRG